MNLPAEQAFRPNPDGDTFRHTKQPKWFHRQRFLASATGRLTRWLLENRPVWFEKELREINRVKVCFKGEWGD